MCLIIHKKKDDILTKPFLEDVYAFNADGWGAMWLDTDGTPCTAKGMKYDTFEKFYDEHLQDKEVMLHFRMATHGSVNVSMAHPFTISDGVYLMHNGVFHGPNYTDPTKVMSDTALFVEELKDSLELFDGDIRHPDILKGIQEIAGATNVVVLMDKDGFVFATGELNCFTEDNVAVSNYYAFDVGNPNSRKYLGASAFLTTIEHDEEVARITDLATECDITLSELEEIAWQNPNIIAEVVYKMGADLYYLRAGNKTVA